MRVLIGSECSRAITTVKVYVHDVGLCTASTISQACDPAGPSEAGPKES